MCKYDYDIQYIDNDLLIGEKANIENIVKIIQKNIISPIHSITYNKLDNETDTLKIFTLYHLFDIYIKNGVISEIIQIDKTPTKLKK